MSEYRDTVAYIDTEALCGNYLRLRAEAGELFCVLKANAYGHGAALCVRELYLAGARLFAVAELGEALELRRALRKIAGNSRNYRAEILILGYTNPKHAVILEENGFLQTAVSEEHLLALAATGAKVRVHAAINTGMNRIGLPDNEKSAELLLGGRNMGRLRCEGIFTHFYCADQEDGSVTRGQFRRFTEFAGYLGDACGIRHACNSAAALRFPEMRLDACRCGLLLYGLSPCECVKTEGFRQVMRLKSRIISLRVAERGETVGYGGSFVCGRRTLIATVPIGYGDGFLCSYAKGVIPLVNGYPAPIIGRVCMDMCMLDVTDAALLGSGVSVGDAAEMLPEGGNGVNAAAISANSINYEITTALSARVERRALTPPREAQ